MKGSEWNKWDLHVHSPMTWLANKFTDRKDIPGFVKKLGESGVSLIGLTNYFFFADNEIEIIREEIKKQNLNITVLPNIELRVSQQNKKGEWINFHLIFSESIPTERINDALSTLAIATTSVDGKKVFCSQKSLNQHGKDIASITVDYSTVCQHMNSLFSFFSEMILAVCPNGYGGFRAGTEGRSHEIATEFDKDGHIVLDGSEMQGALKSREYFLNTERYNGAIAMPVFRCSDAHDLDKLGTMFSWVKAKPTFEGLRQTLIEPEARLELDENWLTSRMAKVHFSNIDIEGNIFDGQSIRFKRLSLPLSEYMVAIIGGRGTGKSLILDCLQSRFTPSRPGNVRARLVSPENFCVQLNKTDGEIKKFDGQDNSYSYLHVSQGEIKDLCQEPEKISDEIKKMLRLPPQLFPIQLRNDLDSNLSEFRTFFEFFNIKNSKGIRINIPEYHNARIVDAQKHIDTLTSEKNRELIKTFQDNAKCISKINQRLTWMRNFLVQLKEKETELNDQINFINAKGTNEITVPHVDFEDQKKAINKKIELANIDSEAKKVKNKEIIDRFRQLGIEQDISGLLDKVSEYQQIINTAEQEKKSLNGELHWLKEIRSSEKSWPIVF